MAKEWFVVVTTPKGKTRSGLITPKYTTIEKMRKYFRSIGFELLYTDPLNTKNNQRRRN